MRVGLVQSKHHLNNCKYSKAEISISMIFETYIFTTTSREGLENHVVSTTALSPLDVCLPANQVLWILKKVNNILQHLLYELTVYIHVCNFMHFRKKTLCWL